MQSRLEHLTTFELDRVGDCQLVGVDDSGRILVEEIYGDDDLLAQYLLCLSQGRIASVDEGDHTDADFVPLAVSPDITRPRPKTDFQHLDFAGARRKGLAASDRVDDLTRSLSIAEKFDLVEFLEQDIEPSRLIGIAESRILSTCRLEDGACLVCRRIRVAYRLPKPQTDPGGLTNDYDSLPFYLMHPLSVTANELPDLSTCLRFTLETDLFRPQDCMVWHGKLIVADGGYATIPSAVHVFEVKKDSLDSQPQPSRMEILEA